MKTALKTAGLAAGMIMAGTLGASAAVISYDATTATVTGGEVVDTPNFEPLVAEFSFEEDSNNGAFFGFLDMNVGREFTLSLRDYRPDFSGSARSFFTILNLDTNNYVTTASTCSRSWNWRRAGTGSSWS